MVVVIFIESKYILLKDKTNTIKEHFFADLPMTKGEKNEMEEIILFMYKDNI